MAHLSVTLGIALIVLTLADTFLTVLNYNQRGLLVNRVIAVEWRFLYWFFKPLRGRLRSTIYRTMTGFALMTGVMIWVSGMVLGFALIYSGAMTMGTLIPEDGAPGGFMGALYYSMGQFSTVGAVQMDPQTTTISILSVFETMLSVLLLSLVITYLANVFTSIEALRTYCACFPSSSDRVESPLNTLAPYLPRRDPSSLETHLATVRETMNAYFDSIAADHSAIYFNSGKDRFVMPFALFYTAGTLEGLTSGISPNLPVSDLPELVRLREAFESNRVQIYRLFRWKEPQGVMPLSKADFVAHAKAAVGAETSGDEALSEEAAPGIAHTGPLPVRVVKNLDVKQQRENFKTQQFETPEQYVRRFVRLREVVSRMSEVTAPTNWEAEYPRYVEWLGFVPITDDFIRRASRLFNYRPVVVVDKNSAYAPLASYGWQSQQGPTNTQLPRVTLPLDPSSGNPALGDTAPSR